MGEEVVKPVDVPGATDGLGGPNVTPAFGNKPQTDNNRPVETKADLESFDAGAKVATRQNEIGYQVTDEVLAAANAGEEQEGFVQYASPSIPRLKVGRWQFENGVLRVPIEDKEAFEKLLNSSSGLVKQAVSSIDREGGEAVARRFIEQTQSKMTQGPSTSQSTPPAADPADPANQPAKLPQ